MPTPKFPWSRAARMAFAATFVTTLAGCPAPDKNRLPSAIVVSAAPSSTPQTTAPSPTPLASPGVAAPLTFKGNIVPILREHCARCHKPGGTGPFAMFDKDDTPDHATVKVHLTTINTYIESTFMPLDRKTVVTPAQKQALKDWQAAGAPDN